MANMLLRIFLWIFTLVIVGKSAVACTVPTPIEFDATQHSVDVVFEGVASKVGVEGRKPFAIIDVSDVHFGTYKDKQFQLSWRIPEGGECAPRGPNVKTGERVRVYIRRGEKIALSAFAWEYVREYPKTRELIEYEQSAARFREFRSEKYYDVGRALAYNDPGLWLPDDWISRSELLKLSETPYSISVSFAVDGSGAIKDCHSAHVEGFKFAHLDKKMCDLITKNAKMVPPVFEEETWGSFTWSPPR